MKKPLEHMLPKTEKEISTEEVRALEIGSRVNIHGNDRHGVHQWLECTVAGLPGHKFLTYRNDGFLKKCPIKEYPNKYYTKVVG